MSFKIVNTESNNILKFDQVENKDLSIPNQIKYKIDQLERIKNDPIISKNKRHITALIMMKDENETLKKTLNSIKNVVDSIICLDTGTKLEPSIKIITDFCQNENIQLHLKETEFIDFSTSRNELFQFAKIYKWDYGLLLDCNDELQNPLQWKEFCNNETSDFNCFYLNQIWYNKNGKKDSYRNLKLIKNQPVEWRYLQSVHEFLTNDQLIKDDTSKVSKIDLTVTQNRIDDDLKTKKRFHRDVQLLEKDLKYYEEIKEESKLPRCLFYLGQSYQCLYDVVREKEYLEKAFDTYVKRSQYKVFPEELFHTFMRLGEIHSILNPDRKMLTVNYFLQAFNWCKRADPLVNIATIYLNESEIKMYDHKEKKIAFTGESMFSQALMYSNFSCELILPTFLGLFINEKIYTFDRYLLNAFIIHQELSFNFTNVIHRLNRKEGIEQLKYNYLLCLRGIDSSEIVVRAYEKDNTICDQEKITNVKGILKNLKNNLDSIKLKMKDLNIKIESKK